MFVGNVKHNYTRSEAIEYCRSLSYKGMSFNLFTPSSKEEARLVFKEALDIAHATVMTKDIPNMWSRTWYTFFWLGGSVDNDGRVWYDFFDTFTDHYRGDFNSSAEIKGRVSMKCPRIGLRLSPYRSTNCSMELMMVPCDINDEYQLSRALCELEQ